MPQLLQLIEESAHLERIDLSSWIDQLTEEVAQAIKARPDIELVRTPYALQYLATKDCGDATQALLARMVPRRIKLSQAIAEGLDELTERLPQVRSIVVEGRSLPDSILPFLNGKRVEVGPSMESASMQKVVTEGKPAELIFPIDLSLVPLGKKYDWWGEEAIWSALRANYKVVQEMFDGSIRGVMEIQSEALSWRDIDQRCGFHNGQIKEITAPRGGKALLRRRASSH